jgi:hypothetical protein
MSVSKSSYLHRNGQVIIVPNKSVPKLATRDKNTFSTIPSFTIEDDSDLLNGVYVPVEDPVYVSVVAGSPGVARVIFVPLKPLVTVL